MPNPPILVTGAAGFIGFHLTKRLLNDGFQVVGVDNLNDYYSAQLKKDRLAFLQSAANSHNFNFRNLDLKSDSDTKRVFEEWNFKNVIHLAAQPGVRYSLINPQAYIDSNITGFFNILEACRSTKIEHLIFASSSSVYGNSSNLPFSEHHNVDQPISLYAATKKSNELMAHTYAHLFQIPTTGLRFFTVYGPWGRPDMAVYLFTDAIAKGREIKLFKNGLLERDFTYVDDIVEGIVRVLVKPPQPGSLGLPPFNIFNIGNHSPITVRHLVSLIEQNLKRPAKIAYAPMEPGDVSATFADVTRLQLAVGFAPNTPIEKGISQFVDWYLSYHHTDHHN